MDTIPSRQVVLERQLARVQRRLAKVQALDQQNKMRTLIILALCIFVTVTFLSLVHWIGFICILLSCVIFWLRARLQPAFGKSALRYESWVRMLNTQIARLNLDWDALPPVPPREEQEMGEMHPFELDLDISGERSLHRLLNTGVSLEGTLLLRDWLLELNPDLEVIRARRSLVRELIPMTGFRNKFLLNSLFATRFSTSPIDSEALTAWVQEQANFKQPLSSLVVALLLACLFYASILAFLFVHTSVLFCVAALLCSLFWYLRTKKEQGQLSQSSNRQRIAFGQLQLIFEFLEKNRYAKKSRLRQLCEPFFLHADRRPSILLKRIERILNRATLSTSSEGWALVNVLFPIGAILAHQLIQCTTLLAEYLPVWLDVWYELEAANSLANFAHLHPEYTFPELEVRKRSGDPIFFDAQALGHPLIKPEHKVVNDFTMDPAGEILLITGSNMAGKSTFLRTIGINLVLAYAGSVVNAASFKTTIFDLYACIRVTDSLADGYSYFYAEVRRLKGLLDLLDEGTDHPVFFLIDEIFRGTNNYERAIGSEAYIRALVDKKCVGAISTHDLELVQLAEGNPMIKNYHFRENIIDGKMVFEYLLHDGPSPTRNALRIMQMEGLPVHWDATPA
ncbi:MutS family DNA mismatch repair protein [Dictyobacter arantiisoli]|uniref:DNA mismatch repair protein n=1 Tax=Dictyobacter arantiisoli TaxID=2014874 RepID=A0A5A5TDV5_9CHLR|nr:MutS family DNA mismatch repair protein [Dictyobacter arantiisoli]GCF09731.1 DNA mismatch repair protein [Dictyobacter arantiisoli]